MAVRTLEASLVGRVRGALSRGAHPASSAGTAAEWRRQRDHWLDLLEAGQDASLQTEELRRLVDFLGESGASRSSRLSAEQWESMVSGVVGELLFAAAR